MSDLTSSFEPAAGLVILKGRPVGVAGEAGFTVAAGTWPPTGSTGTWCGR